MFVHVSISADQQAEVAASDWAVYTATRAILSGINSLRAARRNGPEAGP